MAMFGSISIMVLFKLWIFHKSGVFVDLGMIRAMKRHHQSKVKKHIAWQLKKVFTIVLCDLCFTKDHVPVCFHDEYINRIARDQSGQELEEEIRISNLTYEDTIQYDFGIYKGKHTKEHIF